MDMWNIIAFLVGYVIVFAIAYRFTNRTNAYTKRVTATTRDIQQVSALLEISSGNRIQWGERSFVVLESALLFRGSFPPIFCHSLGYSGGIGRWLHIVPKHDTYDCDVMLWQEESYNADDAASMLEAHPPYSCTFKGREYLLCERGSGEVAADDGYPIREFALFKDSAGALLMFDKIGDGPVVTGTAQIIPLHELTVHAS